VIRIAISQAAFDAIAATLPSSVGVEQNRAPNGDYFIWLDPSMSIGFGLCAAPARAIPTSFCGWRRPEGCPPSS
jgi:hypothetical protein